ncbi:restriction endonuclease subunit S [Acinetobacter radioresistens]|uniref:restriction endonuclease subunit S n=1 Tax=Acinetobacter radioresistens TaxID=40216 RepID=UPI0021CD1B60|nr:restriction endonuclease subunit S [Acinetobacter radioresistens]MCU4500656.1 restriction endonuclease subunit S [Acinetobacter radioresistens]
MSFTLRLFWEAAGGNVPEHWEFKTIDELLEHPKAISVGVMYPGSDTDGGVPLIKVSDVKNGAIASRPSFCISNKVDEEYKRTRLNGSELLLTLVGNPGDCVIVTDEMCGWNVARALAVIRLKDTQLRSWIRYVLASKPAQHLIEARLNTTVQKTLNLKDVREIGIPIPPREERDSITKIIDSIEKKTLLNTQINQTLESIAQALFKSWFIDFDPVRAKIEARQEGKDPVLAAMCVISGKSEAELRQMAKEDFAELQATAALFPDELVESELGEVPKGWELQQFKDIAKYTSNKISLNDLTLENYISTENMLSEKKGIEKASSLPKVNSVPAFKKGNILVSNIRPYFKKIWFSSFEGGHSNDVLNFEVLEEGCEEYLYNLIYQDSFFDQMMASSKGSKMPRGDKKAIMNFQVVIPSITLRRLYSRKVRKFYLKQNIIEKENQALKIIRDTLLPKLLSGEVNLAALQCEGAKA